MAVSTTDTFSGPYLPNGVTVNFPFSFKAVATGDVAVILRDANGRESVVDEAAYSVTLSAEGGDVSFAVAPIASVGELFVVSEPSFLQSVEFASGQPFLPSVVNNVNDRDVARALYLKDRVERSFTVPRGENAGTLPPLAQRAGMLAVFSEDGGLDAVPSNWNSVDGVDDGLWDAALPIIDDGLWGDGPLAPNPAALARRSLPKDETGASAGIILAPGEYLYDLTIKRFRGGDGEKVGGDTLATQDDIAGVVDDAAGAVAASSAAVGTANAASANAAVATTNALNALKTRTAATITRDASQQADFTCDGVADDVQLRTAVNAISAAGGGQLRVRGNFNPFRISAPIELPENVEICGEKLTRNASNGVLFKTSAGVTLDSMFTFTGASGALKRNIRIAHIAFDGNLTSDWCFKAINGDYIKLFDCRFINATNSIFSGYSGPAAPALSTIPGGLYLDGCNVSARGGVGVRMEYLTQCWISESWFTAGSTAAAWLSLKSCDKLKVSNSEFNVASYVLQLEDEYTGGAYDYSSQYIILNGCAYANNGPLINDLRTHPNSNRIFVTGTTSGLTSRGSRPLGNNNIVMLSDETMLPSATWQKPFWLGAYALWIDGSGRFRIKNGAPTSDGDGAIVGTQS